MKIKKILITTLILLVSIFTFFGCAKIEVIRTIDEYYIITDKIFIQLDEKKLNATGKYVDEVIAKLDADFATLKEHIENWKSQFSEYPDLMEELKTGIICDKNNSIRNEYSVYVQFANSKMFYLFYGYYEFEDFEYKKALDDVGPFIDKMVADDYEIEDFGLFFYKYSKLTSNNVIGDLKEFTFNDRNICSEYENATGYNIEDAEFTQLFSYPDDRLYSNSDFEEEYRGVSFFGWEYNNKDKDFQLEIYKLFPKSVSWYILGLIISAVVVVSLFIVYFVKFKKKEKILITKADVENE